MHKELVILVDALEEASIQHLQESSLLSFGYLAALHAGQSTSFSLGLCAVHRQANRQDVQLKVLQRPGPFNVRDFSLAVRKLHAAATPGISDAAKTGLALKSLISHLAGRSGLPAPLQTTVCLLGHVFSCQPFRRAIADADRAGMRLQFVALVPTVDAVGPCMSDAVRSTFLTDLVDAANATASFIPNDPESLRQLALQWVRDFVLPPPQAVVIALPTSLLHCSLLSQVLPLTANLAHGQLCACHKAPLADPGPDGIAGICSINGAPLQKDAVLPEPHIVELGHSTRLAFATGAVPSLQVEQLPVGRGGNDAATGDAAPGEAMRAGAITLRCVRQMKVVELSEGLIWGQPHLLAAGSDALVDIDACEANEQTAAALCQVLRDSESALLLAAGVDLDRASSKPTTAGAASSAATAPFTCYYAARPSADCAALLVRRIASAEELLPVVAALPPPCQPSQEALDATRAQLSQLSAGGVGGLFSPLDHSSGAFGLLRTLLQGSVPAPQRPPVPVTPQLPAAQQQLAAENHATLQQENLEAGVPQPHRLASGAAAASSAHHSAAAQLGGRLQRLRLPDCTGGKGTSAVAAAAAASGGQRKDSGGRSDAAAAAQNRGRQPLRIRQAPVPDSSTSGGGRQQEVAGLDALDAEEDWPEGRQQQHRGDGVTRFNLAVPHPGGRGGGGGRKGRQRSSGGSARGGLQLKRLRKAQ